MRLPSIPIPLFLIGAVVLAGCPDPCEKDPGSDECCEEHPDDPSCPPDPCAAVAIDGFAVDLLDPMTSAAEGLCVYIADPTASLSGGDLEIIGSGSVGADGAYLIEEVPPDSAVGLLVLVQDCDGDPVTVLPTATGLSTDAYRDLVEPECSVEDKTAFSIDAATQATLQGGLALAGFTGDLAVDGSLIGFALDASGQPIDGVTVSGPEGLVVYYFTGTGFDTASGTVAAASAMFVIPGAEIAEYTCQAGGYTFESTFIGSQPGFALVFSCDAA